MKKTNKYIIRKRNVKHFGSKVWMRWVIWSPGQTEYEQWHYEADDFEKALNFVLDCIKENYEAYMARGTING